MTPQQEAALVAGGTAALDVGRRFAADRDALLAAVRQAYDWTAIDERAGAIHKMTAHERRKVFRAAIKAAEPD